MKQKHFLLLGMAALLVLAICSVLFIMISQGEAITEEAGIMHKSDTINVDTGYVPYVETQTVNPNSESSTSDSDTNEEVAEDIIVDGVNYFDASMHTDFGILKSWGLASSLNMIYEQADYIVIGSFGELESSFNMARSRYNSLEEDPYNYHRGLVYTFNVQAVLKGTIESDTIRIGLPYLLRFTGEISNHIFNAQGETVRPATEIDPWTIYMRNEFFIEPNPNELVMLFLAYVYEFGNFRFATEPSRIVLEKDGTVGLMSNILLSAEERVEIAVSHGMSESGRPVTMTSSSFYRDEMPEIMAASLAGITGMSISDLIYTIRDYNPAASFDAEAVLALLDLS